MWKRESSCNSIKNSVTNIGEKKFLLKSNSLSKREHALVATKVKNAVLKKVVLTVSLLMLISKHLHV